MEKELTIYLLRGLSRESAHWGSFDSILNVQFPNSKINYIDMPGAGIYHKSKSPSSIPKIVEVLREKKIVNTTNNLLIASSMGGMVALEWITKYPNDFNYVATICSTFNDICKTKERFNLKFALPIIYFLLSSNIRAREKIILRINSNDPKNRKNLIESWVSIQNIRKLSKRNFIRQSVASMNYNPLNPKVEIPLLIIGSKKDQLVHPNCIEKVHKKLGGKLIWHETSGHCIPLDAPEWLSKTIFEWYQQLNNE